MIQLRNVSETTSINEGKVKLLVDVNLTIPTDRKIAILQPIGNDRGTLIDLLAGVKAPMSGQIVRTVRVSYPVGYLGGFKPQLKVRVNIAHVARLYGADPDEIVSFVSRIRHFRPTLNKKFSEVPGPLRHDLGVLVASLIPFDVYLLPSEISKLRISPAFKSIASAILQQRARTSGMIVQTQDPKFVRKECDMVILLHRGKLLLYDDVEKALSRKRVIRTRLSS